MGVNVGYDAGCYTKIEGSQTDRQPAVSNSAVSMLEPSDWLVAWLLSGCLLVVCWLPGCFLSGSRLPSLVARCLPWLMTEGVWTDIRD